MGRYPGISTEQRWLRRSLLVLAFVLAGCSDEHFAIHAGPGSAEPHLARLADGRVVLSYLEPDGEEVALRYRVSTGRNWGPVNTVATGRDWLVNWADFPSVQPFGEQLWAAHWLVRREGGGYAYDIAIAVSRDGGLTWSPSVQPHLDSGAVEHGFVSLYAEAGEVGAVWLDGRNTPRGGATQLRGATLGMHNRVVDDTVVADRVCDCCQTDIAVSRGGPVLVYRGRSEGEIRDIHVALRRDGRWQPGVLLAADNWEISGCPVNGPAVDAVADSVAVAWYTAHPDKRVQVAFSNDGGATFAPPVNVDATQTLGRVDVVIDGPGRAVVSWLQRGRGRLVARRVSARGELGPVREIAPMVVNRDSGFPQMIRQGEGLVFAWTDASLGQSRVRTAYVESF